MHSCRSGYVSHVEIVLIHKRAWGSELNDQWDGFEQLTFKNLVAGFRDKYLNSPMLPHCDQEGNYELWGWGKLICASDIISTKP